MNPRAWCSLCRATILESVRRKDIWVVAILGGLIVSAAGALGFFGFEGLEVFAKDLAVTVVGALATILAALCASRMIPEELRNRTLYPLLARPVTRLDFLIGKYLGAVAASWIAFLLLCSIAGLALLTFGVRFELIMAQYVLLKALGLALICAVSLLLSTLMTPSAAATLSLVLALGSDMISRALTMAYPTADSASRAAFQVANWALPHFGLFDIGGRVAGVGWAPLSASTVLAIATYGALYGSAVLGLSWARIRRKAI